MSKTPTCTVTGPGVERQCQSPEIGLSLATTLVSRVDSEVTFYVRDHAGDATGRVERDAEGIIRIYSLKGTKKHG